MIGSPTRVKCGLKNRPGAHGRQIAPEGPGKSLCLLISSVHSNFLPDLVSLSGTQHSREASIQLAEPGSHDCTLRSHDHPVPNWEEEGQSRKSLVGALQMAMDEQAPGFMAPQGRHPVAGRGKSLEGKQSALGNGHCIERPTQ